MTDIVPEDPADAGVPEQVADTGHEEGARLLGDEAVARLAARGFTEDQVRRWAETFIATVGTGDVDAFVAWIATQERTG